MGGERGGLEQLFAPRNQAAAGARDRLFEDFLTPRDPTNRAEFDRIQAAVNQSAAVCAGLIQLGMTPWAERGRLQTALTNQHSSLSDLQASASEVGRSPATTRPLQFQRMSTIQCHQQRPTYEPPRPVPYRIGDLRTPTPTQPIVDAMATRAIGYGNEHLNQADRAAFQNAVNDIGRNNNISLADRAHILGTLAVLLSPGENRALPNEANRRLAQGLAQAIAHPPMGATGDLRLAGTNPRQLADRVLDLATAGRSGPRNDQTELTEAGRREVREATTPQQALDRLLGSTRAVIPNSFEIDMTALDRQRPAFLTDEAMAILRQIHEADGRIRSISVTHQANGDDRISIGLEAGRTDGDLTLARTLGMTVHRAADGSVSLTNMSGIQYQTGVPLVGNVSVSELRLGRASDPNRRIVGCATISIDVTDQVPAEQITQFDQMIGMLNRINQQRR